MCEHEDEVLQQMRIASLRYNTIMSGITFIMLVIVRYFMVIMDRIDKIFEIMILTQMLNTHKSKLYDFLNQKSNESSNHTKSE